MHAIALSSSTHAEGHDMQRHAPYLAALLALFSVLMMSMGSELEQQAVQRIFKRTSSYGGPEQLQQAGTEVEVIRDRFAMFIIMGGSFAGAVTYISLRVLYAKPLPKESPEAKALKTVLVAAFILSVLTSLFLTPLVVKYIWKHNAPEECAFASYLISAGATILWDILNAIGKRYIFAAEKGGFAGIRNEYMGAGLPNPKPEIPLPPEQGKV